MQNHLEEIEDIVTESGIWEIFLDFLGTILYINEGKTVKITISLILLVFVIYIITTIILIFFKRLFSRRLLKADKAKFYTVFSFARWIIYSIVLLIVFDSVGIKITAIFATSAVLLIGVCFALKTLFQDVISGTSILVDHSLHVGDSSFNDSFTTQLPKNDIRFEIDKLFKEIMSIFLFHKETFIL